MYADGTELLKRIKQIYDNMWGTGCNMDRNHLKMLFIHVSIFYLLFYSCLIGLFRFKLPIEKTTACVLECFLDSLEHLTVKIQLLQEKRVIKRPAATFREKFSSENEHYHHYRVMN